MQDLLHFLALAGEPGLRRLQAHELLTRFGSPRAVYGRGVSELRAYCAPHVAASLARGPDLDLARADLARAEALGLRVAAPGAQDYPAALASIPDPPLVLWIKGIVPERPVLAIVGARRATPRGREVARSFAAAACEAGYTVVSGLAYGIDAAAHRGALEAGGPTLAVLASGLDLPSPKANIGLARRMLDTGGGWISEYPPGTSALAFRFPERNRLISGLSGAVLVVEAGEKSGSLWTVRHALDQGRDVLGVPGPVDTASCQGSNRLLRDGAGMILDETDLLDWLGAGPKTADPARGEEDPKHAALARGARTILELLSAGPMDVDEIGRRLELAPPQLAAALLELELRGSVVRDGGKLLRTRR